jgi:hypothetical protein
LPFGVPYGGIDSELLGRFRNLKLKEFIGSPHRQFVQVRRGLGVDYPLDLLVRCPADVTARVSAGDFFLTEVIAKGIVLRKRWRRAVRARS